MIRKKQIVPLVLLGEIVLFLFFYYHGAHGLKVVYALQQENSVIERKIKQEKQSIVQLEKEIEMWRSDPFYKEKLAREKLHMARSGEEVYLT